MYHFISLAPLLQYNYEISVIFFEKLKNNFRGRNHQAFECYNDLQEKYYQVLELNLGIKYDNMPDNWNYFFIKNTYNQDMRIYIVKSKKIN